MFNNLIAIFDNQFALVLLSFALGSFGTFFVHWATSGDKTWKIADLLWVTIGGLSALAAIASATYESDRGQFARQSDVIYATTKAFEIEAGRFRLLHCETDRQGAPYRSHVVHLCEKVEFLSASTSVNRDLPFFLSEGSQPTAPRFLQRLLGDSQPPGDSMSSDDMMKMAKSFDAVEALRFSAYDEPTKAAIALLAASDMHSAIAAEYQIIGNTYDEFIKQLDGLTTEWAMLQEESSVVTFRFLALCLLAFAAPFRLGKSVVELRS